MTLSLGPQQTCLLQLQMHTVAPLQSLRFRVTPRKLPPIQSISISSSSEISSESLQQALQMAFNESSQHKCSVTALAEVHDRLQAQLTEHGHEYVNIAFDAIHTGNVEVVITDVASSDEASITGLEASAKSGKGWGMQPFQCRAQQVRSIFDTIPGTRSSTGTSSAEWCRV